ncbi:TetR family transcriptional regulator [Corynebacterium sp. NML 150383]|uniref:TetR/AcrR family transcriptional regulator n=1 Tax=Corynebacterium sp. NML 150383 TaxID=2029400 RepID=UPI000BAA59C8|nr:TetR/AcrR family transcriptional regulator [Corynebacterium sp. NML 150383]PAT04817.1 TetR family transcriptional regulator [Corynebacterium sp. NML 150383]
MARQRMTGKQRRDQLIAVGCAAFAERGLDGISVEELASRSEVSKPVIYEHFGGKEGLYRAVIDVEMQKLETRISAVIQDGRWRERIEKGVVAVLEYVEEETDGFIIIVRGQAPGEEPTYTTLLSRVTSQVSALLAQAFRQRGLDDSVAALYGQALVGTVSNTALWWLDERQPDKYTTAAHIANMCWNGLRGLEAQPHIVPCELSGAGGGGEGGVDKHYKPTDGEKDE